MSAPVQTACAVAALIGLGALAPAGQASQAPRGAWQVASLIPRPPQWGKVRHKPRPKPKPAATPRPAAKPTPSPAPVATPTVVPAVAPTPGAEASAPALVTAEGSLGTWVLPTGAGGYDLSFSKPTFFAEGALWWGNLGVSADVTVFNAVYANFRTTPFFQPNTFLTDALIAFRFDAGHYRVFGGYRGLGLADLNFATLGFGFERPVVGDWLSLDGRAQYGNSFSGSYVVDGEIGLAAFLDPLTVHLGFRHLALLAANNPLFQINGPTAGIGLRF